MSRTSRTGRTREQVVLLDDDGRAVGAAPKQDVHHRRTPLHLAFSCYLFDPEGRLLVTRRALAKTSFPGVWTNSCCGHPAPGERLEAACRRRLREELGVGAGDLRLVLPRFRYAAVAADGLTENEMCPVLVGTATDAIRPDPAEVEDHAWVPWPEFRAEVLAGRRTVSSWCREQVAALPEDPRSGPPASPADLPPAVRW